MAGHRERMQMRLRAGGSRLSVGAIGVLVIFCFVLSAQGAPCRSGSFDTWLEGFRREAAAQGISQRTIAAALGGVSYDPGIISRDRGQGVFRQSFEQFAGRMVSPDRLQKGAALLRRQAGLFSGIERRFGVPGPILVAIWGLETDFGVNQGRFPTIRSLATLAYDCRRSELFQAELLDALRIVERGDLSPTEMRGAWAGEIGQTQFLPSSYIKYALDYDGNGRRDLIHSAADALASTANYLKSYGWRRGEDWTSGSGNFPVLLEWNKSQVYSKTIAYFATRLAERE
jgi:lytic murein transglycosylase